MADHMTRMQKELCRRFSAQFSPCAPGTKVGIARNVRDGLLPINGLRHRPEGDTSGWFLWAGDVMSSAPDFFVPLHVEHVAEWCPRALQFLGLPPGWRFLAAEGHEDVWEDARLLQIEVP